MPRKNMRRRPRRAKKARKFGRGRKAKVANMLTVRGPTGIPDRMRTRLTYCATITFAPAAPFIDYIFRGNSVFDPDLTGVGHQPLYFDQYAALYTRYRVHASSIRLDMINGSPAAGVSTIVIASSDSAAFTQMQDAVEQRRSRYPKLIPVASRFAVTQKSFASTRSVTGLTKIEMSGDDVWAANIGSNPAQQWYWHVLATSVDGLTNVAVSVVVRLVYYVEFYDTPIIAGS